MKQNMQSPIGPKFTPNVNGLRGGSSNLPPPYPVANESQFSNNEAAQAFLNSVRQEKSISTD